MCDFTNHQSMYWQVMASTYSFVNLHLLSWNREHGTFQLRRFTQFWETKNHPIQKNQVNHFLLLSHPRSCSPLSLRSKALQSSCLYRCTFLHLLSSLAFRRRIWDRTFKTSLAFLPIAFAHPSPFQTSTTLQTESKSRLDSAIFYVRAYVSVSLLYTTFACARIQFNMTCGRCRMLQMHLVQSTQNV